MTSRTERVLDDIGWRILHALQEDSRLSFSELGRRVGLSAPAVAERVRRMEAAGVILGYRLAVGLEAIFPITAIVRVSAPEANCTALSARTRDLAEVIEAYRVTGDDRLVLKVVTRSVAHLDWVIAALGRYGTPTVSIVLKARSRPVQRAPEPARPVRPAVATPKTSASRPSPPGRPALSGRRLRRSDLKPDRA